MDEKINKNYIIIAVLVLVIVAGVSVFLFFKLPSYQKPASQQKAKELISGGYDKSSKKDLDAAISDFEALENSTENIQTAAFAKLEAAQNRFLKTDDTSREESILSIKAVVADEKIQPRLRAWSINRLIDFYLTARDPKIFGLIFQDGIYKTLAAPNDKKLSVRRLAEYSDAMSPTSHAKLRIAMWYSGELLDKKNLDANTKKEYGDKIKKLIAESENLFDAEVKRGAHPIDISKANFYHFRAFNLAALGFAGLNKPEEKNLFEDAFKQVINLGDLQKNEDIRMYEFLAYTNFYYGSFLYEIFNQLRLSDIKKYADITAENVTNHPSPNLHPFCAFTTAERTKDPAERDHNYRFFLELSSISDKFKNLLIQKGWDLK